FDLPRHAIEPFLEEPAEGPARTVPTVDVAVVDGEGAFAGRCFDLAAIDRGEPVVRGHLTGGVEDESAEGVPLVRVRVHALVGPVEVLVHGCDRVDVDDGTWAVKGGRCVGWHR